MRWAHLIKYNHSAWRETIVQQRQHVVRPCTSADARVILDYSKETCACQYLPDHPGLRCSSAHQHTGRSRREDRSNLEGARLDWLRLALRGALEESC